MEPVKNIQTISNLINASPKASKSNPLANKTKSDSSEISDTSRVFLQVDRFLNLGSADRLDPGKLNSPEGKEYLKILSGLLKKGVVGYEVLKVNGQPEKHFIETEIGDSRLKGAKVYKRREEKRD